MKNITITLPDDIAHKAKVFAAEHNTSVSRYLGQLLAASIEAERGYEKAMNQWKALKPSLLNEERGRYPSRDSVHDR